MKKNSFPGLRTLGRCAVMALSVGALAACNSDGTNGNGDGGNGDGGNGDGGTGAPFTITVMRAGAGMGKVTSQPAGISCDGTGSCNATFPGGTAVTLTAQGLGSAFSGWTGACAGQSASCQISPTGNVTTTASFDPLSCTTDFICWEAPLPFGMDLSDVFAISANNVWAVGTAGTTLRYDGTAWRRVQTSTTQDLVGLWARSASDIWAAAGANGLLLHYDGSNWNNVTSNAAYRITGIYGAGASNLYAATQSTDALHSTNNGANWTARATGVRSVAQLIGISGSGTNDVWAVDQDCGKTHWDGGNWTALARDTTYCPVAIYSFATNNAWGVSSTIPTGGPVLWRYTGGAQFTSSGMIPGASQVRGLWGPSANTLFTSGLTAVLHSYNGTSWSSTQTSTREANVYPKIHGTSGTDVWAVGARGVITHFDGTTATAQRANVFSGNLVGAWGSSANNIWFPTDQGTLVHYDGVSYTEGAAVVSGGGRKINQIHGTAADDIWLAGADSGSKSVLLRYNGTAWTPTTIDSAVPAGGIERVWAGSRSVAWAGPTALVNPLRWDGTQWQIDFSLLWSDSIEAIWGTGVNDIWLAAGTNVFHNNGTTWSQSAGINAAVYSFGGIAANNIWAGGNGVVYRYTGTWSGAMTITGAGRIVSISATAANDVWFTDEQNQIFRWNGATFRRIDTSLAAVSSSPAFSWAADVNNVWFAGRGILSYRR